MNKKQKKIHCDSNDDNSMSYPLSQPVRTDRRLSPSDSATPRTLPYAYLMVFVASA